MTTLIGKRPKTEGHVAQIWILAALTLPFPERVQALDDIADLLGTTYAQVQSAASRLSAKRHADATEASGFVRRPPFSKTPFVPSAIRPLSMAALMSGRAPRRACKTEDFQGK